MLARRETSQFSDVYGGGGDVIGLDCHLVRPRQRESDEVLVFMHPTGGGMYLPIVSGLARAGHHVIWANSRYRGTDSALIMEKVAADLGAVVADARDRLGYRRVVLAGWSGGGSLSLWYQALAEAGAGIRDTPAGDAYRVEAAALPKADAVLVLAAHVSRHATLTEWLDPSIEDEARPFERRVDLNLYDPRNPHRPPFTPGYVERFRAAQIARNRRITEWVRATLDQLRAVGEPHAERAFVVHGTMADPRWLDGELEPSDREVGRCYLGDPKVVNDGPVGLARFCTLRSWLSQWSWDDARADAVRSAAAIVAPVLVVGNTADDACTPSHARRIFAALGGQPRRFHEVVGATHYYTGAQGREHLAEAVRVVGEFLAEARG
ncbi:MAG: alpha/beta hydrolase [Acidobacteria bacterium]|nr:MAG: alpha/beta hydrolase [Acidobacteriota bacterium]REK11484.1 MAG: alpha/beta hydrolase [Acidobacteriota bacterium]